MTINNALGRLVGVSNVDVDVPSKTTTLSYDPTQVSLTEIEEALTAEGCQVAD